MPWMQVGLKFPCSMQSAVPEQYDTPGASGMHVPEMSLKGGLAGSQWKPLAQFAVTALHSATTHLSPAQRLFPVQSAKPLWLPQPST